MMTLGLLSLFLFLLQVTHGRIPDNNYYLLVSMDGFRWDYLDLVHARNIPTPNFDNLINNGVKAKYMKNAFVTVTWPNHWTLATGMHVESHGVVANDYYDRRLNASFSGTSTFDPVWYDNGTVGAGGEPIWVTYQKAAEYHRSGMVIWPGGNVKVNGIQATYRVPPVNTMPFKQRVDHIIQWFTMEQEPAHLGILYFGEPDQTGHDHGPYSIEVEKMILKLDATLGYLIERLKEEMIFDDVNMIVTSDHGMTEMVGVYKLDDYVNPEWYHPTGSITALLIDPVAGHEEDVYQAFKKIPHSTIYHKEDIPRKFFYSMNERIMPLVLITDLGYATCCYNGSANTVPEGDHGFSNEEPNMHPFFIAHGPAFKSKYVSPPFNNTDVYPLMCHLLGVQPHPNNGSLDNIKQILRDPHSVKKDQISDSEDSIKNEIHSKEQESEIIKKVQHRIGTGKLQSKVKSSIRMNSLTILGGNNDKIFVQETVVMEDENGDRDEMKMIMVERVTHKKKIECPFAWIKDGEVWQIAMGFLLFLMIVLWLGHEIHHLQDDDIVFMEPSSDVKDDIDDDKKNLLLVIEVPEEGAVYKEKQQREFTI